MTDERFDQFADDVRYIRTRVDTIGDGLSNLRVSVEQRVGTVEGRMSAVETKVGGIVLLSTALGGVLAWLGIKLGRSA